MRIFLLVGLTATLSNAFQIIKHEYNSGVHKSGDTLTMKCKSDTDWEYCAWRHVIPQGRKGKESIRECNLEWKRLKGGVQKQTCHPEITDRVEIHGSYEKHECGIQISNLSEKDSGVWECELEAYVLLGGKGSGQTRRHTFNVLVQNPVATTPTTITTIPTINEETTTTFIEEDVGRMGEHDSVTETNINSSQEPEIDDNNIIPTEQYTPHEYGSSEGEDHHQHGSSEGEEDHHEIVDEDYHLEDDSVAADTDSSDYIAPLSLDGRALDSKNISSQNSSFGSEEIFREPLTDNTGLEQDGSLTIILVVLAVLVLCAVGATGGFVYMRRKRGFNQIVSMQKLKESGVAADGFLFDDVNSSIHANNMPNPIILEK